MPDLSLVLPETLTALREYYEHAELTLPAPYPNWRNFRVQLPSGRFFNIPDRIRTPQILSRWALKLLPLHIWASTGCWLDPQNLSYADFNGKKAGYNHAQNILIHDDLVFDVDFHTRTFKEAKADALTVLDYLHELGYETEVHFTGAGFQLVAAHHDLELPRSYSSRNNQAVFDTYANIRKPIVEHLIEKCKVQLDEQITYDVKRVIRVLGTVNSKNGYVCSLIWDLAGFELERAERVGFEGSAPMISCVTENEKPFSIIDKSARRVLWGKGDGTQKETKPDKATSANRPRTPTIYLGSPVLGTVNRQIIMLSFKEPVDLPRLREQLSRFAEYEKLAPFVLFKSRKLQEHVFALSPTAIQTDGMKRLLKKYPRDNAVYQKFRRRIMPLPVKYLAQTRGVLDSERPCSRGHYRWLYRGKCVDWTPKILCGANLIPLPIGEMNS